MLIDNSFDGALDNWYGEESSPKSAQETGGQDRLISWDSGKFEEWGN